MTKNMDLANFNNNLMGEYCLRGAQSKKQELAETLPNYIYQMQKDCVSWMHDFEFFDTGLNCIGVNINNLLPDGEYSITTALEQLFREIIVLTNSIYGGIGFINFDSDLAKYITTESDLEISRCLSNFFLNLNSFIRKGCERAYTSLNIVLDTTENGRRITKLILLEFEKGFQQGNYIFPNIIFKLKKGCNLKGDTNYDLLKLSCQVTSKCTIPTYFNTDTNENSIADAENIGIMGCRTRVVSNKFGQPTSIFRGNIATTINLVQLSLLNKDDMDSFFIKLKEIMEKKSVIEFRLDALEKSANFEYLKYKNIYLDSELSNKDMLRNATLSIGFIGLYECSSVLLGTDDISKIEEVSYEIIKFMRKIIDEFNETSYYQFSLLASSSEGVSGRFPAFDLEKFGEIENITTNKFYTNSFHLPVYLNVSCFEKIDYESKFHSLCYGGNITYIELKESANHNVESIIELVEYAYSKQLNYFGINFSVYICKKCNSNCFGLYICDSCGSDNILKLRRVSGYLSELYTFSNGKKANFFIELLILLILLI